MLYYLSYFKDFYSPLNIFQYLTFRIGGAIITSFIVALIIGPHIIKKLKTYKINQIQRRDGPPTHFSKDGTTTMGGIIILFSILISTFLWTQLNNRFILLLLISTIILAFAGWMDDYIKLVRKDPKGASSSFKFSLQIIVAMITVVYLAVNPPNPQYATHILVPYTKEMIVNMGVFYFIFEMIMVIGTSNAVNLTDGQDGLASGLIVFTALTFLIIAYCAGNVKISSYLKIVYVNGAGEISVFLATIIGACLGFMWFNSYPAQIFMGDTSSLFLGGSIGVSAILIKQELLLPVAGALFILETLSVIIQMASFRLRNKKRVFLMAPIHHHFELKGIPEPKVTVRFWIVGIMLMLAALASLKIR